MDQVQNSILANDTSDAVTTETPGDIKPQNFLLVPVTPFADRILATTAAPRDKFVFQMVDDDDQLPFREESSSSSTIAEDHRGDVKLFLRDPSTAKEDILRLRVKLTDFGLAQPLEVDASHLSIKGCFGTILYMAPETLRPTELDGTKRVSPDVDVWALGIILFQMLGGAGGTSTSCESGQKQNPTGA